jgi:RNA polymerase-interacting CarD/CdnL/TRCF family regulator
VRQLPCRLSLDRRVNARLNKMRRILHVDTQHTRKKLLLQLEDLFEISSNYARGKVQRVVDKTGKERPLTIAERQFYARIAAYIAQIINNLAKGIDERQIDRDLDKLEAMLNKTTSAVKATAVGSEPPRKSEGT